MTTLTLELPKPNINLTNVKVFYNQRGQASEVLLSYEVFQQIATLLQALGNDQAYFWTKAWQERILQAEADVQAGRVKQATLTTIETALEWLDE